MLFHAMLFNVIKASMIDLVQVQWVQLLISKCPDLSNDKQIEH